MSEHEASSDPLPFAKVDRAVKPKVAMLASGKGMTYQHALGSVLEFWDLCAEPRELERLVAAGHTEIVLTDAVVEMNFKLASGGFEASVAELAGLGFVEHRAVDVNRVRGMSRRLEVIEDRLRSRESGRRGGKKSAELRKPGVTPASGPSTPPSRAPSTPPSSPPQPRGQRSEDREEKKISASQPELFEPPDPEPPPERRLSKQEEAHADMVAFRAAAIERQGLDPGEPDDELTPASLNTLLKRATEAIEVTLDELVSVYQEYLDRPEYGQSRKPPYPLKLFLSGGVLAKCHEAWLELERAGSTA